MPWSKANKEMGAGKAWAMVILLGDSLALETESDACEFNFHAMMLEDHTSELGKMTVSRFSKDIGSVKSESLLTLLVDSMCCTEHSARHFYGRTEQTILGVPLQSHSFVATERDAWMSQDTDCNAKSAPLCSGGHQSHNGLPVHRSGGLNSLDRGMVHVVYPSIEVVKHGHGTDCLTSDCVSKHSCGNEVDSPSIQVHVQHASVSNNTVDWGVTNWSREKVVDSKNDAKRTSVVVHVSDGNWKAVEESIVQGGSGQIGKADLHDDIHNSSECQTVAASTMQMSSGKWEEVPCMVSKTLDTSKKEKRSSMQLMVRTSSISLNPTALGQIGTDVKVGKEST